MKTNSCVDNIWLTHFGVKANYRNLLFNDSICEYVVFTMKFLKSLFDYAQVSEDFIIN